MNKLKLFQFQIINKKSSNSKPIINSALLELNSHIREIVDYKEFEKAFLYFLKLNKKSFLEHLEITKRIFNKTNNNEIIEITYYFTPFSLPEHLLNFQVEIDNIKNIYELNEDDKNKMITAVYAYFIKSIKDIEIDNMDEVSNISLKDFNLIK